LRVRFCGSIDISNAKVIAALVKRAIIEEAEHNLEELYDRSVRYFEAQRRFPQSTGPTPERLCATPDGLNHPQAEWWEQPAWKILEFRLEAPFYYQYSYRSEGEGLGARFVVRAEGDLNCNGVTSVLEIGGSVDSSGHVVGERRVRRTREGE
jgi:hypothetical protein